MNDWQFWALSGCALGLFIRSYVIDERIKELKRDLRKQLGKGIDGKHLKKPGNGSL